MNIHVAQKESIVREAAKALNKKLAESQDKEVLFLSSGGSSLALLDHIDASLFGPTSTVSVLDERYSTDPTINNFAQLTKTEFYGKTLKNGCRFIDTRPKANESIDDVANRFENALKDWLKKGAGVIIATVGVGPDAHTAGMMPYPEDKAYFESMFDDDCLVRGYDAGKKSPYPLRVTTTMPLLRKIDFAVTLMKGGDKKEALARLKSDKGYLHESPCRIIREIPNAEIFIEPPLQ